MTDIPNNTTPEDDELLSDELYQARVDLTIQANVDALKAELSVSASEAPVDLRHSQLPLPYHYLCKAIAYAEIARIAHCQTAHRMAQAGEDSSAHAWARDEGLIIAAQKALRITMTE